MRKDAREAVFVLLYRDCFCNECDEQFVKRIYKEHNLNENDISFANNLYSTVKENEQALLSIISNLSQGFMLNRIFLTDKCALLIGLCEMTYFPDVPKIVAIDEAVSLTKKFSGEKSQGFVNGILAEYKKQQEADS
ncbi:MAG: transcription antitermination factor NusB [Clostridia bacterium]|nr:transcription antitermination factor NusB [Clostridia bacterium]